MFCANCGSQVEPNAEFCLNCGIKVNNMHVPTKANDEPNIWANIISLCCFPILGIILYFVWKDQQPKAAKSALIFGLIGFGLSFAIGILFFLIGIFAGITDDSYYYY